MTLLVAIFLRGGADGLSLCVPHTDDALYEARPHLLSPRPDQRSADAPLIDLDARYGLHPELRPLLALFERRELAIVHGVASDDDTHSHFEAQDRSERCAKRDTAGWIAEHLRTRGGPAAGPFAGLSVGPRSAESLRGAASVALSRAEDLSLGFLSGAAGQALSDLYLAEADSQTAWAEELSRAGGNGLEFARSVTRVLGASVVAPGTPTYPDSTLGQRLRETARLARAAEALGIEAITVDHDGWDTHFAQADGLASQARDLAACLRAFSDDLGARLSRTLIVVMTEFGRRVEENVSLGSDHGHASLMLLLGAGVRGGRVFGDLPRLGPEARVGPGDVPRLFEQRAVLAEVVQSGLNNPNGARGLLSGDEPARDSTPSTQLGVFA